MAMLRLRYPSRIPMWISCLLLFSASTSYRGFSTALATPPKSATDTKKATINLIDPPEMRLPHDDGALDGKNDMRFVARNGHLVLRAAMIGFDAHDRFHVRNVERETMAGLGVTIFNDGHLPALHLEQSCGGFLLRVIDEHNVAIGSERQTGSQGKEQRACQE